VRAQQSREMGSCPSRGIQASAVPVSSTRYGTLWDCPTRRDLNAQRAGLGLTRRPPLRKRRSSSGRPGGGTRVLDRSRPLRAPTGPATGCQVVSDVAALPAAQPEPLGAACRYGCRRGLRPWQFSLTSQSDVNAAPSDEKSRPARRVSPGHRFKDGLRPRAAALWRPLYGESADLGHRQAQPP